MLLVPDTAGPGAALAASSARTVARYDAFTLVEASGADEASLRDAGAVRRDDMRTVDLPGGSFDPLRGRDSLAARDAPDLGEALAVVQFAGPVKDAWLERLRASGARIVQYVPQNGYLVHATGAEVDRLAALVGTDTAVRAVTRVGAGDKLSDDLGDATRMVAVQTLTGAEGTDARQAASSAGPSTRGTSAAGGLATQYLTLTAAERDALAADPAVVSISPYSNPEPLDERSAQIVAGNLAGGVPSGPGYLAWLGSEGFGSGTLGFSIDVSDTGLDTGSTSPGHPDFRVDGQSGGASRVAYAREYSQDTSANDCSGHGTNVASIAGGFGAGTGGTREDGEGYQYGMGVAPRVTVGGSKIFSCGGVLLGGGATLTNVFSDAYGSGARISNHSWGYGDLGRYSADSREFDFLARDAQPGVAGNQPMVEVVAAGNSGDDVGGGGNEGWGSVASPGTAKNAITVGASESRRPLGGIFCGLDDGSADNAGHIADFSSRGPTNDGRMKPDLVAPGTRVVGAAPQTGGLYSGGPCPQAKTFPAGNTLYSLWSGSSQAAPAVSGAAALIRAWYPGGAPSPALTKAILVNTATDLAGGDDGRGQAIGPAPNADQGWGRAHLGAVLDGTQRSYVDQTTTLSGSGARFARTYGVTDAGRPLKVTLAWTDAPGMVDTAAYVNDLDLVVRQGGRTYRGNAMAGGRSIAGGEADRRNNIESVVLPGATGRFSVEVIGMNVAGDGVPGSGDTTDQDFALVVSNAQQQAAAPVLAAASATVGGGDGDGSLESSEPFSLSVGLVNGGDGAASGVSGSLSGPGLTFSQSSSSWGSIAAGATAAPAAPMVGTLAPGSACGVDIPATLSVNTGQGPVALSIPTGEPGPPLMHSQVAGIGIPDETSAGAAITRAIATSGRIKDLNVRVNISHQWVGDLVIDLTSPQGTTVRLADHPGGPDNGGDNLSGTVFDDEAPGNISAGGAPYIGSFRPQADQLSRFDGEQLQGNWTLRVRDLFEGQTGTLLDWGMSTSTAVCDFDGSVLPDTTPPDTSITAGPAGASASRSASFSFAASDPDSTFECSLDGAPYALCNGSHTLAGLAEGSHSLRVQARDPAGNVDPSPAGRTWTVDLTSPALSVSRPGAGAAVSEARPRIAGSAGRAAGDSGTVSVSLWRGTLAAGLPAQTLVVPRSGANGTWSAVPARLRDGTWTARAAQTDAAGNTGYSAARTFRVDSTAPGFALMPLEAGRGDVLGGRLTVLAGCGSRCKVTVELLGAARRRPPLLGRATKTLAAQAPSAIRVKLTQKGRSAVRRSARLQAKLSVKIAGSGRRVSLSRAVLIGHVGLGRVAGRGLAFAGRCSEQCSLSAKLLMRAPDARRHGLKAPGARPVAVAGGSARSSAGTTRLVLRLTKASRKALRRARSVNVTFEAVVRARSGPSHKASHRLTLRR